MARWIRVEPKDAITVLTLDRQARRNAMHAEVWQELEQVATELAASPPRVLVVTGAGGHFSAGMDLSMDNAIVHRLLPLIQSGDEAGLQELIADLQASMNALSLIHI